MKKITEKTTLENLELQSKQDVDVAIKSFQLVNQMVNETLGTFKERLNEDNHNRSIPLSWQWESEQDLL